MERNKFTLNSINLTNPVFHLKYYKNEKNSNLSFLLDYFSSAPDTSSKPGLPLDLKIKSIKIKNADFIYADENIPNEVPGVIDYDHLHIRNFTTDIKSFSLWHGEIRAEIKELFLKEKCGFEIEKLQGNVKFTDQEIEISNLLLLTPYSNIHDYYSMRFDSLADFNNYIEKVRMYADFNQSVVSFKDIRYFASAISKYTQVLMLNGKVSGTVANLKSKNIEVHTGKRTHLIGEISIKGLPEIEQTDFYAKLSKLNTDYDDVVNLLKGIDQDSSAASIPIELRNAGLVQYVGYYTGTVFNFKVNGQASTDIGNLVADFNMNITPKIPTYKGTIQTIEFDFGKLLNTNSVGTISLNAIVDGKGFSIPDLKTNFETDISLAIANGYPYKNIIGKGNIESKNFIGNVSINDEHIKLNFDGSIDFNDTKNPVFDFDANIDRLDLRALNVLKDTLNIKSNIKVNFIGSTLDNLIGSIVFNKTTIESKNNSSYTFKNIVIDSKYDGTGKSLTLKSDLIDAGIQGEYKLSTITSAVKSVIREYLPSYNLGKINKFDSQDFKFYAIIEDAKPLTDLIFPKLTISNEANLRGYLNTEKNILRINSGIDFIKYDYLKFEELIIDGENDAEVFDFNIACEKAYIQDSININNIAISNSVKNDSIHFNIKLADKTSPNQLDLNGLLSIKSSEPILQFLPSEILIDSLVWAIKDSFQVKFASDKKIYVSNFEITNANQKLSSYGVISKEFSDEFIVDFHDVSLKSFNQILKKYNINIQGLLNARTKINGMLGESILLSNINMSDLIYNNDSIGNLVFNSTWDPKSDLVNVNGSIYNKRLKTFGVSGYINTKQTKNSLNIDVVMNETELAVIEPFVKDYISRISGKASADLKIRGSFAEPDINGYLTLKNVGLRVNYLNTDLKLSDQIRLSEDKIYINNIQVKDVEGNKGTANGIITHKYFEKFKFDVKLQTRNLVCLNTSFKDNELYYGKAYASGQFLFRGPLEDLKIDIDAKTEAGTKFFIPLTDANSVSKQNFIRFINKDSTNKKEEYNISLSGISMNMNLQVDEQSEVQLILNKASGEVIKGTGNANLKLVINTLGTFEMYGIYEIADGEYNFVLQNLITRKFKVDKGGTIRWNGDPLKAKINLSAVYETRPQVYPLITSASPSDTSTYSSTQRVKTECVLNMKNDLMQPDITFGMRFPEDQSLSSKVGGYLANTDNLNNQVASLLVFGRFSNTGSNTTSNLIPTTGFLTSQLSSLVSTKNFDLNLANGVGGSLRLFNDRITIDGTINTATNSTTTNNTSQTNASSITGDVNIDYKISKDGRFRAKAFQRNDNNSDLLKRGNTQVEQGLGLFYRIEFDTFGELMRKIFKKNESKDSKDSK